MDNLKKKIVVFDMDDTLWSLNAKACEMLNIDYRKLHHYSLDENRLLTEAEKEKLQDLYQSVDLWKGMKWEQGAEDIHKLSEVGGEVFINSNCLTQAVADYKRTFVGGDLHLDNDHIILNVTTQFKKKKLPEDTLVFVDDSPYNIQSSTSVYDIMLDRPWNREIPETETRFRCYSVVEATELIRQILVDHGHIG